MSADVAIIGLGCRFPGARDVRQFWANLRAGVESIRHFSRQELIDAGVEPAELDDPRYVRASPVLDEAEAFDAEFFGYSPREAMLLDPQQRLFLEVCWAAFEDAGYRPDRHRGQTGVFAGGGGIMTSWLVAHQLGRPDLIGATGSLQHLGNDKDFLATRVSYELNLKGPSLTVQTACSTSLVALHLACRSLMDGECDMAIAGGAVVRFPHLAGYRHEPGGILSPDGHCRAFDAKAAGTVFGSGVGAVLLKRLDAAVANGDQVYAVVKSTAINNDGNEKLSYTTSSVPGQARAVAEALALADVDPGSIGYVECHGTGTFVGDPLEIQALTRGFGGRPGQPGRCAIGSVKTNVGHLEQAAGLAALIKTALILHHGEIPPTLGLETPNPRVDWTNSPFYVCTQLTPWPGTGSPRRAGVNALGLGGTNAFAVLEAAPAREEPATQAGDDRPLHLLALGARSEAAGRVWSREMAAALGERRGLDPADVCFTCNTSRSSGPFRVAVVAGSTEELREGLAEPEVVNKPKGRLAFLFTGQGSQTRAMGRELDLHLPVYRAALDRIAALLAVPVREVLYADDDARLHRTEFTQPTLFALQMALVEVWRSWGVEPDLVLGHSIGEMAAVCALGILPLPEACAFVSRRAALMGALPREGGMLALFASPPVADALIRPFSSEASLAAVNAPEQVVVSGTTAALAKIATAAARRRVPVRRLRVSHAFHSGLLDPVLNEIEAEAARLLPGARADDRWFTNLTGGPLPDGPDARYWREQVRRPVRFLEGMQGLVAAGARTFIEIGPGTTLQSIGRRCAPGDELSWGSSLGGASGELRSLLEALRTVYLDGHEVDWEAYDGSWRRRRISLPPYPFQGRRHVLPPAVRAPRQSVGKSPLDAHPLPTPLEGDLFEGVYDLAQLPWNDDHRIYGFAVLPTTAALEAVRAAAASHFGSEQVVLENVIYREALVLPEEGSRVVQIAIAHDGAFRLFSRGADDRRWRLHLLGRARRSRPHEAQSPSDIAAIRARCRTSVSPETFYREARATGLAYGPRFQGIRELWTGEQEALSRVRLPDGMVATAAGLHPALLDACLHVYAALAPRPGPPAYMPVGLTQLLIARPGATEVWAHARRRRAAEGFVVDLSLTDLDGAPVAELVGLSLKQQPAEAIGPRQAFEDWLYRIEWRPAPATSPAGEPTRWLLLADEGGLGAELGRALTAGGDSVELRRRSSGLGRWRSAERVVYLWGVDDGHRGGTREALAVMRTLAGKARLTLVTRAAWPAGGREPDPFQALLWGLGRTAAHELGQSWDGMIDVGGDTPAAALAQALRDPAREPELALVGDRPFVPRLVPGLPSGGGSGARVVGDATYLVTGGRGALGDRVVRSLAAAGARNIVVMSRAPRRDALPALPGVKLEAAQGDVSSPDELARVLSGIRASSPPLRGVFHCAGLLDDGIIQRMETEQLERVLRPKVDGAWQLHLQTAEDPLDHFVLFSSVLSILGSAGQANYTAANAFLDALASARRLRGAPASSINWGPWAGSGIATASGQRGEDIWRTRGTAYIPPADGAGAIDGLVISNVEQVAVTITDWPTYLGTFDSPPPMLSELGQPARRPRADDLAALRRRLEGVSGEERRPLWREIAEACARSVLGLEEPISENQRLADLGLDSLIAVTLSAKLEAALGVPVSMARLLEGPTIPDLVDLLLPPPGPVASPKRAPARGRNERDWVVAIQPRPSASVRLLCFPFAGGGSAVFREWGERLGPDVEVLAIEPPGRLRRMREAPVRRIGEFVGRLADAIVPWLDRPYACFGHCLGGLTMFETVRALRDRDRAVPLQLFAAGARPPHRVLRQGRFEQHLVSQLSRHAAFDPDLPLHDQPAEVFADLVRAFRIDATERLLEQAELRDLMFPTIRAEFQMASRYVFSPTEPFQFPVTVFLGRDDPYVSRNDALGWGRFTEAEFRVHTRPGAHFLLAEDSDFMLGTIGRSLNALSA